MNPKWGRDRGNFDGTRKRSKRAKRFPSILLPSPTFLVQFFQPFEAQAFSTYMAARTLLVDVWDADALMHLGTLSVPLRTLMRQQRGVVKTAMVKIQDGGESSSTTGGKFETKA